MLGFDFFKFYIAGDTEFTPEMAKLKDVPLERLIQIKSNLLTAETRIKTGEIGFYDLPVEMAVMS